jgi:predicted permease
MLAEIRYAVRGLRRSPLFAASVAATIGLGLGVLCSAVTFLNAYLLKPIDLPDPYALYGLSWDTADVRGHSFTLADVEALRDSAPHFSSLAAGQQTLVMQGETVMSGGLVTGNYFSTLGATPALGRLLTPADAAAPGDRPVVVLSDHAWRSRFGANPNIVGTLIELGRQRFEVVGVTPPRFGVSGDELVGFWALLTMSRAFSVADPWNPASPPSLFVLGRLRADATAPQARAAFEVWLRQRFPSGTEQAPVTVRVESRATRLPLSGPMLPLVALIVAAFGLVLLVACANVTNLLLARALARQREIAVRLSLGAGRWRVARQLAIESLVLAIPASAVGLAITLVTARVVPALMLATWPRDVLTIDMLVLPIDPDARVLAVLFAAAVMSALLVTLAPAVRASRANLVQASKGDAALDSRRSRLRTGLVAIQIGACTLFLVWAIGLIEQTRHIANPDTRISHERVASVQMTGKLRAAIAERIAADPTVESVAAAMKPPLGGPLESIGVVASTTRLERTAGFTAVSPEYFPMFGIRVVRGRAFTAEEANQNTPVVVVSDATARLLWPNLDPIGQTLEITPASVRRAARRPSHTNVRVIGVAEDVINGMLVDGIDETCIYFASSLRSPGVQAQTMLVRGRRDAASVRAAVTAAVKAIEPEATFQFFPLLSMMGAMGWIFQAFSTTASILGAIGLLLALSGTYAVVAFLMAQRTRELGIRMALGATVQGIVSGMIGETLRVALVGLACALALAALSSGYFSGALPFIPVFGARAYLTGTAIVLTATVMAALLPSLRAARIDPSKALRVD